jgi:hypothetical protein
MGDIRNTYRILHENQEKLDYLGDLGMDENILKWILNRVTL